MARDSSSIVTGRDQLSAQLIKARELYGVGLFHEAEQICTTLLDQSPSSIQAMSLLSAIYTKTHRGAEALVLTAKVIQLAPNDAEVHTTRAAVLNDGTLFEEALAAANRAMQLKPGYADALIQFGIALKGLYRFSEALNAFRDALSLKPALKSFVESNLVILHAEEGQYETSRRYADALVSENPNVNMFASMRHRFGLYTPSLTRKDELERAQAYWDTKPWPVGYNRSRQRVNVRAGDRIKIGYFSSDFKTHPVSKFLMPVLKAHDQKKFQIGLIDTTPNRDTFSETVRSNVDFYHDGLFQSDTELASSIQHLGVDILIDLTGIFKDNRLNVFRCRPAPIQVSWIGYSGTTALKEMDYIIADGFVCPADADEDFTEEIVRLPDTYLCYENADLGVPPRPFRLPGEAVTFGSFNNHLKLNQKVIGAWAEILKRTPRSRLFLKSLDFQSSALRQHIRRQFEARGISKERLRLEGPLSQEAHFAAYNQVDIALDPFPYCGTTTSAEALSMGVPLITLIGERWVQRTTYGFLSNIGVPELAVTSEAAYINLAIKLAQDPIKLEQLRGQIKDSFAKSPISDAETFTRNLEAAYRKMWMTYCEKQGAV